MGYICVNCKFRPKGPEKECPYCGKRTVEKEKSAEELLNEVDGLLKD